MKCSSCGRAIPNGSFYCNRCGAAQGEGTAIPSPAVQPKRSRRANGEGTVYKRGGKWYAKVRTAYVDGNQTKYLSKVKGGFQTKSEARDALPALREALLQSAGAVPKDKRHLTVSHYWASYESNSFPKLSRTKQANYRTAYNRLKPIWNWNVADLTVDDLRNLVSSSCQTFYPAHDMKIVLQRIFDLAAADGIANRSLPSFIILPDKNEKERQPFTPEEAAAIFAQWQQGNLFAGYIILMMSTGMMPGELAICKKSMIDLDKQVIVGSGLKTKQRKEQSIVLPPFVIPVLKRLLAEIPGPSLLPRMSYYTFREKYYAVLKAAGCRMLPPYSCRHTTATILALDPTVSLATVSRVMRHSQRMTERYTHASDEDALQTVSHVQRLFGSSPTSA